MAIVIINGHGYEIADGSSLSEPCFQEGLSFNCNTGVCGSCQVNVLSGTENLSPLSDEEKELGLDENTRLACVCFIEKGSVELSF